MDEAADTYNLLDTQKAWGYRCVGVPDTPSEGVVLDPVRTACLSFFVIVACLVILWHLSSLCASLSLLVRVIPVFVSDSPEIRACDGRPPAEDHARCAQAGRRGHDGRKRGSAEGRRVRGG